MLTGLASETTHISNISSTAAEDRGKRSMAVVLLYLACHAAIAAPAAVALAPQDSLWHWCGWKTPTSLTRSTGLPPAWEGCLNVGASGRDK